MAYLSFSLIFIRIINLIVNIIFRIIGTVIIATSWSIRSASTQHWHRIIIIMVIVIFTSSFLHLCYSFVHVSWGGSRTAATFKVELFVIIVNRWKPLTIITKSSTLDVAAVLDPHAAVVFEILSHDWKKYQFLSCLSSAESPLYFEYIQTRA